MNHRGSWLVPTRGTQVLVRERPSGGDPLGLPVFPDTAVAAKVRDVFARVPVALWHAHGNAGVDIWEHVSGAALRTDAIIEQWPALHEAIGAWKKIGLGQFEAWLPQDWPTGSPQAFYRTLLELARQVHDNATPAVTGLWHDLGVPGDPVDELPEPENLHVAWKPRHQHLLHGDLRPGNLTLDEQQKLWIGGWDHAIWGDPAWEAAIMLHRCRPTAEQTQPLLELLCSSLLDRYEDWADAKVAVDVYSRFEHARSVLAGAPQALAVWPHASGEQRRELSEQLARDLRACRAWWPGTLDSADEVVRVLDERAPGGR